MSSANDLAREFLEVRNLSTQLTEPLLPEDHVPQPVVDVSPPKWHLAHTTWFFETFLLQPHSTNYRVFHPKFNFLFNSYYHSVGERWSRPERGHLSRPGVKEILQYRKYVDKRFLEWLENISNQKLQELEYVIRLGLHHEQQHQELLLTDLKYIFGQNPLFPVYREAGNLQTGAPLPEDYFNYSEVAEGIYPCGFEGNTFCFDNERPVHNVFCQAFSVRNGLVTNGEFLEFLQDGGYNQFNLWLSDGWDWVNAQQVKAPFYWKQIDGQWFEFTLRGLQPLNLSAPVTHISFYEAEAFATWSGQRLLTEEEWEVFAKLHEASDDYANLLEKDLLHPSTPLPEAKAPYQLFGDAWEWTYSAYHPYPGYRPAAGALGEYNGKFMINQMVLRGGSCVTPPGHIRITYRNFFQPEKRWQFTAIRLAR